MGHFFFATLAVPSILPLCLWSHHIFTFPSPAFLSLNKVHDGSRDGRGGAGGAGGGGGGAGSAFAEAGRGNVELLWRVTEAFCPGVTSVLAAAQVGNNGVAFCPFHDFVMFKSFVSFRSLIFCDCLFNN